jgi:hypothetical protein
VIGDGEAVAGAGDLRVPAVGGQRRVQAGQRAFAGYVAGSGYPRCDDRAQPFPQLGSASRSAVEYVAAEPVPWWPQAAVIVILRDAKSVASVAIEPSAPEVFIDSAPAEFETDATALITWTTRRSERPVTCLLRYSNDAGRTSRAIAADLKETR